MRKVYVVLTGSLIPVVALQFYFAAVGAFTEPQTDSSYALHSVTGMMVMPGLSVLAAVAAAVARAPGRLIGFTLLPFGMVVLQMVLIALGEAFSDRAGNSTPVGLGIVGLHAVNGMLIMAVSHTLFQRARAFAAGAGHPPSAAAPAPVVATEAR